MEALLQYVWKHRLFPLKPLTTADGQTLEVIDTGLQNTDAGPDFFNAKVKIDGTVWAGNVEIHDKASLWHAHGHDRDKAYSSVVLHVVGEIDADAVTCEGRRVYQLKLDVPQRVTDNYTALLSADRYPPCRAIIPELDRLTLHGWTSRLLTERLERKTAAIERRVELCGGSWEEALFATLARSYGFGVNGEAFERWAACLPLSAAARQRDDLTQTEALFIGQAGLLEPETIPERCRGEARREGYFDKLRDEYRYLAHKFGLKPMDAGAWKFMRMRPQNFPYIRLSQLARLYCSRKAGLGSLAECATAEQMRDMLQTGVTPYWETHYTFGSTSCKTRKSLSPASLDLIIINAAAPMLFAYGRHRGDERMCSRAFDILTQLKAENNRIVRLWRECGLDADNAGDSQALIQLKSEYCDKKGCLRCRIGYRFLKGRTTDGSRP